MKKVLFRLLAYTIDLIFVNIIIIAISNISFINKNIPELTLENQIYQDVNAEYNKVNERIDDILFDKYIDLSEATEINADFHYLGSDFYQLPMNQELTDEQITDLKSNIETSYTYYIYAYNYDVTTLNTKISIIGIVISILYFGIFEWYMRGKTIGKMIFRLRTVDNTNAKRRIPLWKYLVKALLISGVLFTTATLILGAISTGLTEGPYGLEWFNQGYTLVYNIQYIYNTLFLLLIFIRTDERSAHDCLLGIRVLLHDKNNKEVESKIFNEKLPNQAN